IGGSTPGAGNVISGNPYGVFVSAISHPVIDGLYNSVIIGNSIGLNGAGPAALGTVIGIGLTNADNRVGGKLAGEANVIAGNTNGGIQVSGATAIHNLISQNSMY